MNDLKQEQVRCGICGTAIVKTTAELPGGFREDCDVCRTLGANNEPHGHYYLHYTPHLCFAEGVSVWGPIPADYWPVERS